ncbi:MAG: DUF4160 domain-containing protein [Deltaproteobacteria bacterium]|nr:DUF4160 domain-containing protein [Deltaproteobacteria bacterium]
MGRIRRGGYLIEWWIGDHLPKHVHVYKNGKEIAKIQVPELLVLSGTLNKKLEKILKEISKEISI